MKKKNQVFSVKPIGNWHDSCFKKKPNSYHTDCKGGTLKGVYEHVYCSLAKFGCRDHLVAHSLSQFFEVLCHE